MANPGLDRVIVDELLRSAGDQGVQVPDDVADEVGDAARRVRGVAAALERDDLQVIGAAQPPGRRRRTHRSGIPADHDQPLPHLTSSPSRTARCHSRRSGGPRRAGAPVPQRPRPIRGRNTVELDEHRVLRTEHEARSAEHAQPLGRGVLAGQSLERPVVVPPAHPGVATEPHDVPGREPGGLLVPGDKHPAAVVIDVPAIGTDRHVDRERDQRDVLGQRGPLEDRRSVPGTVLLEQRERPPHHLHTVQGVEPVPGPIGEPAGVVEEHLNIDPDLPHLTMVGHAVPASQPTGARLTSEVARLARAQRTDL